MTLSSGRAVELLRAVGERLVAVLKQQLLEASQPVSFERKKIQDEIERFYWAHREEVLAAGRKSVDLAFGRLGSRSSRGVLVKDATAAQQWLAANGLKQYLRVRTELDRESLRSAMLGGNPGQRPPGDGSRVSRSYVPTVNEVAGQVPASRMICFSP